MIQVTPHMRILVAVNPVDFRNGIDGLAGICRNVLQQDPFSGYLFVFCNRSRTSIKILSYDTQGFWVCQKRLSKGRLKWWPGPGEEKSYEIYAQALQILIWNGAPDEARFAPQWRRIPYRHMKSAA